MNHSRDKGFAIRTGDIIRRWPLLLLVMAIAMGASWWSHKHDVPSYTATTQVVVVPLPQWDETFLGTDLVRDAGDATRTALTVATELKSEHYASVTARYLGQNWTPESVAAAVSIAPTDETNVIEIAAQSTDPDTAKRLASGFATAMTADRWQTIAGQLETRIVALGRNSLSAAGDGQGTNPAASEQAARLQTLAIVRDGRVDPTLRLGSTSPAVRDSEMSLAVTLVLAALGGLFVGALAAAALELRRRSVHRPRPEPEGTAGRAVPVAARRAPANGSDHVDVKSR